MFAAFRLSDALLAIEKTAKAVGIEPKSRLGRAAMYVAGVPVFSGAMAVAGVAIMTPPGMAIVGLGAAAAIVAARNSKVSSEKIAEGIAAANAARQAALARFEDTFPRTNRLSEKIDALFTRSKRPSL